MDGEAWQVAVHRVTKSQTELKRQHACKCSELGPSLSFSPSNLPPKPSTLPSPVVLPLDVTQIFLVLYIYFLIQFN